MKQEAAIIAGHLKTPGRQLRHTLPASRFKDVKDPRRAQGQAHRLAGVLTALLIGLVVAAPTLRDVEALLIDVARLIGLRGCPPDSTLTRVPHGLTPNALLPCVGEQVRAMHRSKQLAVDEALGISGVAIDGKALLTGKTSFHPQAQPQGSKGIGPPYVLRVLRAMHTSSAVKPILGQRTIPAATNESATFWPFM